MKESSTQIRLKKVIQFINKHPNCTTEEITLGVSIKGEKPITVRTIQNDLKYLRGNWKDGKLTSNRGVHTVEIFKGLPEKAMTQQPKIFLKLALESLENLSDLSSEYQNLIKKFKLEKLQNPFYIKPEEYAHLSTDKDELKDLHAAINSDTNIAFKYQGKPFHVEPYRLVNFDGIWYLYGRDIEEREDNDHKTWLLKDIDDVEIYYGEKHDTSDEEIDEDLDNAHSAQFVVDKYFDIKLKVSSSVAHLFRQKNHLPRQNSTIQEDGSLLVTSTISTYADIDPEVKSWLPHIEILEPKEYRDSFIEELREYMRVYGD
jgi:predicted DNA-binding transcriptional regulator YafY